MARTSGTERRRFTAAFRDAIGTGLSVDKAIALATKDAGFEEGQHPRGEGGQFTGFAVGKGGRELHKTEGHATHQAAAIAALAAKPNAKSISTGRGYNGSFDMRFHRPDQVRAYNTTKDEGGGSGDPIAGAKEVFGSITGLGRKIAQSPGGSSHGSQGKTHDDNGFVAQKYGSNLSEAGGAEKGYKLDDMGYKNTGDRRMYHKDAAKRFRATVRDAARENMPLPKIIELGVISGTVHNEATPQSEGKEYQPTKDAAAFRKDFRDALAKGVRTADAIKVALR